MLKPFEPNPIGGTADRQAPDDRPGVISDRHGHRPYIGQVFSVFKRIAFLGYLFELGFQQRPVGNGLLGMRLERIEQGTLDLFSGLKG